MCGGHLDANSAGTGAADNVAGVIVAMETLRILKAIGVKPRRTIRVALWGSEESGLLGSRAYVNAHFMEIKTGEKKASYDKFAGYFNLDSGTGKIRGINYLDYDAAIPIFTEWLKPLKNLGATHLLREADVGSDCRTFKAAGLPGFSFVQDRIDYDNRSYHTNMDVYDRLIEEDLMQAAVVMATFVYHAAMRDEVLPRTEIAFPNDRD
jgi:carboxypeptidase Q